MSVGGSGGEEGICGDVAAGFVDPPCDAVLLLEVPFVRLGREIVLGHLVQQVLVSHDRSAGICQTSYFRPQPSSAATMDNPGWHAQRRAEKVFICAPKSSPLLTMSLGARHLSPFSSKRGWPILSGSICHAYSRDFYRRLIHPASGAAPSPSKPNHSRAARTNVARGTLSFSADRSHGAPSSGETVSAFSPWFSHSS